MKCPFCIKKCTKCGELLVAYSGNFKKAKTGKWGLNSNCKECDKKYREKNKKQISEYHKQYYKEHKEEKKQYYEENRDKRLKYDKQYYEEHKEEKLEKHKQYYEEHKEEIAEYKKEWQKDNPHKVLNAKNKRRSKEENQGRDITKEQWYEMMCWFDWCCAYSGEYIGGDNADKKRTTDHIISISKGGLNEPWNCVPMLKSYNSSKCTNNMEEWYIQQEFYSEERLIKIYAWCEYAFKKWKPRRKGNKKNQ